MDRDKLAEKAVDFYIRWMQDPANEGCTWGTKGVLADFALEVLAERDAEIADKLEAIAVAGAVGGTGCHIRMGIDLMVIVENLRGKQ